MVLTMGQAEETLQKCFEELKVKIEERINDTENYEFNNDWWNVVVSIADDDTIYNLVNKFDSSSLFLNYMEVYKSNSFYSYSNNPYYGYDRPDSLGQMNVIIAHSQCIKYLEENTKEIFEKVRGN